MSDSASGVDFNTSNSTHHTTGEGDVASLVKNSTKVKIDSGVRAGDIYLYIGDTVTEADNHLGSNGSESSSMGQFDLRQQDYADTSLWQLINEGDAGSAVRGRDTASTVEAGDQVWVDDAQRTVD